MRTTITLDEQLGSQLQDRMRRTGKSFKETIHDLLLKGLTYETRPQTTRFLVQSRPMGLKAGVDPSRLQDLESEMEVDRFLEVSGRLARSDKSA